MADTNYVRPLAFGRNEEAALIALDGSTVEIKDRDLSRLWFVMSQVMDEADLTIVRDSLEHLAPQLMGNNHSGSPSET